MNCNENTNSDYDRRIIYIDLQSQIQTLLD